MELQGRRLTQNVPGAEQSMPVVNPVERPEPAAVNVVKMPSDPSADLAALKEQVAQLVSIVSVQQKTFATLQEEGLRASDAAAIRDERLKANIYMGNSGFVAEMEGPWTMNHIDQLRFVMRSQMQQDAVRNRQHGNREALAHRKGAKLPEFSEGD